MKTFIEFLVEAVHIDRLKDLTPKQQDSIDNYTTNSHYINHYLHENYHKRSARPQKNHVRNLDEVFANKAHHVGKDHTVYTGLHESPQNIVDKEQKRIGKKPEHVHVHLPAYTSTSTDKAVANEFTSPVEKRTEAKNKIHDVVEFHTLKIYVPAHHPSISVQHTSANPHEKEVLLHRGTRLKIHAKPTIKTKKYIEHDFDHRDGKYKTVVTEHKFHEWHTEVVGHHLDKLE